MYRLVSLRHNPQDSSPDESPPTFTPSPRSSHSSIGQPGVTETNSFELRTIAPHGEPVLETEAGHEEHNDHLPSTSRASVDSARSYELYTHDEDRAVLRRLDRKLVSFMALLYCLSFLDRSSECLS
jgi:hypothetical protein